MVLPVIPLTLAAGGIGTAIGSLLTPKGSTVYNEPYSTYAPKKSLQIQYPDYQTIINSPGASTTTKKSMNADLSGEVGGGGVQQSPTGEVTAMLIPVVVILGLAYVGGNMLGSGKK